MYSGVNVVTPKSSKSKKRELTSPEFEADSKKNRSEVDLSSYTDLPPLPESPEVSIMADETDHGSFDATSSATPHILIPPSEMEKLSEMLKDTYHGEISTIVTGIVTGVLRGLEDRISSLEKTNSDLKKENKSLTARVNALESQADQAEQYSRRNCLRISGYTEDPNEKVDDIVMKLASDVGSPIQLAHIRLFADDTRLFIIVDDPITSAARLNTDLDKISRWAITWLVTFNPTKSESFLVSRKLNRPIHPHLYMQGVQIEEVECHKHLGVFLSNDCSWHQHMVYLKEKAWCRINIMRKLKFKLDRKSLETIYIAFIRPLLEYADVIWDNCSQYEKDELEKVQIEAARISTGATKLISISNLYKEICWDKLQKRRDDHKRTLFYKMYNNLTPNYLSSLIPQQIETISQYNLRNAQNLRNIRTRTSSYYNSFFTIDTEAMEQPIHRNKAIKLIKLV